MTYSEGGYGENGGKQIQSEAKRIGFCIAFTFMLPSRVEASDYEYIVKLLQEYSEAKVITLFLEHSVLYTFFHQMEMHDMFHNHIWFGTDTIHSLTKNKFEGIFTLAYPVSSAIKELRDALESWSPLTDPENPWVYEMWQNLYNCAWHQSRQTSRWCGDFLNTTYCILWIVSPGAYFRKGVIVGGFVH